MGRAYGKFHNTIRAVYAVPGVSLVPACVRLIRHFGVTFHKLDDATLLDLAMVVQRGKRSAARDAFLEVVRKKIPAFAIVNVSTMVADYGAPGMGLYGSSKAAINLLTKAWAAEYGPRGVRVNEVSPGPTRTEGTEAMGEGVDQLAAQAPAGRPANADEIAEAIVFLATDRASFIHGAKLAVDGGRTAI